MLHRAFTPDTLVAGEFTLDGPEAHHLATVLRVKPGERITLFNGDGAEYPAEILAVGKRSVTLNITERCEVSRERTHALTIAAAMPKGDRGDFLVEKLTELGVARFVPLITERSVVSPKLSRIENLRRTVIEASKQCGRNVLMVVEEPMAWPRFAKRADLPKYKLILHPETSLELSPMTGDRVIAIGPEGGFTDEESNLDGWKKVSLGPRILRIETAAIAACGII